jgi:hypothetical protein
MPLKTRGRNIEIADSGILLIDSELQQENAAAQGKSFDNGSFHCSGRRADGAPNKD